MGDDDGLGEEDDGGQRGREKVAAESESGESLVRRLKRLSWFLLRDYPATTCLYGSLPRTRNSTLLIPQ